LCTLHSTLLAGILSQGFWPDGEHTVSADAAGIYELTSHKSMGFNMIRKHIKVALAMVGRVIKCPPPSGRAQRYLYAIIAVIAHAPMKVRT
jgi:hypothetical protein